jgi:hypothetical protein
LLLFNIFSLFRLRGDCGLRGKSLGSALVAVASTIESRCIEAFPLSASIASKIPPSCFPNKPVNQRQIARLVDRTIRPFPSVSACPVAIAVGGLIEARHSWGRHGHREFAQELAAKDCAR